MEEKKWINKELERSILDNIKNRYERTLIQDKILKSGRSDLLQLELSKIYESPIYFFQEYLYTDKNPLMLSEEIPNVVPFLLFDYQKDALETIWESITTGKRLYIEKSRQMGISWLMCGVFLYGFLFFDHKYLLLSQKEEYVDAKGDMRSLFEKMRFMMRLLPLWMLGDSMYKKGETALNSYMRISKKAGAGTGSITGESSNPNAGTGGTYNAIFMDEMAKMQNARAINTAVQSATGCIIYNSTPLGEFNEYARMRKIAYEGRIESLRLHWKLHPVYSQKGWYEWKTAGMDSAQIAQELEISFNASVEGAVYPNFHPMPVGVVEFGEFPYNPQYPLFISIDNSHGGTDPHAVILAQVTEFGKIRIIDSVQSESYTSFTDWAQFMAKMPSEVKMTEEMLAFLLRYKNYKKGIFIGDPYDTFSTSNDTSIAKEYMKVGIIMNTPNMKQSVQDRIGIVRNNLSRLQVNNSPLNTGIFNEEFIQSAQNARYPEKKENSQSTNRPSLPVHDDTSHFRTALEYLVSYIVEQEEYGTIKSDGVQVAGFERKKRLIERADPLTGAITSEWK